MQRLGHGLVGSETHGYIVGEVGSIDSNQHAVGPLSKLRDASDSRLPAGAGRFVRGDEGGLSDAAATRGQHRQVGELRLSLLHELRKLVPPAAERDLRIRLRGHMQAEACRRFVLQHKINRPRVGFLCSTLIVDKPEPSFHRIRGTKRSGSRGLGLAEAVQQVVVGVRDPARRMEDIQQVLGCEEESPRLVDALKHTARRCCQELNVRVEVVSQTIGLGVACVLLVNQERVMRHAVPRPADRRFLVLEGVVVGVEESSGSVQRQAELVAMVMAVALSHELKDGNRIAAGPVTGRLVGPQHRQPVTWPDL